jgi:hypothetical protein
LRNHPRQQQEVEVELSDCTIAKNPTPKTIELWRTKQWEIVLGISSIEARALLSLKRRGELGEEFLSLGRS